MGKLTNEDILQLKDRLEVIKSNISAVESRISDLEEMANTEEETVKYEKLLKELESERDAIVSELKLYKEIKKAIKR